MARGDQSSQTAEQIAQRKHDQCCSDGLRANCVPYFPHAAMGLAYRMLNLIRGVLNATGHPLGCASDQILGAAAD